MAVTQNGFPVKETDTNFSQNLNQSKAKLRLILKKKLAEHSQAAATAQAELEAIELQIMSNDPLLIDAREFDNLPFEEQFAFMNRGGKLY
jgi:hypothetical protein